MNDRLLPFVEGDEFVDPFEILARHPGDARSGLVEDELVQVACHKCSPEGDRGAVGMAEEDCRLFDGADDLGHVLELALDRVLGSILALAAAAAVDRVEGETIRERGDEEPEAPVRAGRPVDEHQRRSLSSPPVRDPRSVARSHILEDAGSFSHASTLQR